MRKKLFEGIRNAKLKMKVMALFTLFLMAGTVMANARGGDSPETLEAQQSKVRITGTVVDRTGEPVIGANIVEKGVAANGTVTDVDGKFSLSVSPGATLTVSYIGYVTQEIAVENRTQLQITLQENLQALDEVIVIGYGAQKKVNLTGAVATVDTKTLESRAVPRLTNALQGQVANLNITPTGEGGKPYSTQNINIRGFTGFGTAGAPLIVIDGIQGGNINNINPDDVESISILKDAASSAIYGSSAPYGVILITTKRGRAGEKPAITYSNGLNWKSMTNEPKAVWDIRLMEHSNIARKNSNTAVAYDDYYLEWRRGVDAGTEPDIRLHRTSDAWEQLYTMSKFDLYFSDAEFSQQHNVGVSGSLAKSSYYIGLGYMNNNGLL